MKQIRKLFGNRLISLSLAVLLALGLTACGREPESDIDFDWVYVHEFLQTEGAGNINWQGEMSFGGDKLYYTSNGWNEQTEKYYPVLHRYSFLDGGTGEQELPLPEETNLTGWDIGEDGCLYALLAVWGGSEALGISGNAYMVAKYDAQGKEVFVTDFSELLERESFPNRLVVDGEGRIYAVEKDVIWLFDAEGAPAGNIKLRDAGVIGQVKDYCRGSDGCVYVAVKGCNGSISATGLFSVDFEGKRLEEELPGFPDITEIIQNAEGSFLINDGNSVSIYNEETQEKEKLFDWLDCDVQGSYVTGFGTLSDGRMVAAFEDRNVDDKGIIVINRVRADQVTPKQEVVLGTLTGVDNSYVVHFNRSSNDYHVTVRQYLKDYEHLEDALNRLNADIVSDNCPDLLDLDNYYMEVRQMASNGVFEDLTPYLEQSSIDRDDMFETLLEDFTYGGKLICIPDTFSINTVIGSTAKVGKEMGWTTEDVIALAEAYPEASLFDGTYREKLLLFLLDVNSFVDWETGTCHFDSDEFKRLLEFIGRYPGYDEMTYDAGRSTAEKIQSGEVLLIEKSVYNIDKNIQYYKAQFGGEITCIGYPNIRGDSVASFSASGKYAIMTRSKLKEGAWAFIESYLSWDHSSYFGLDLPNRKSKLERLAEEAVNVEYVLDENGEPVLDENGNPKVVGKDYGGVGEGDWMYYFRAPTREEVDMVLELIRSTKGKGDPNYQMRVIIDEEVAAYFLGQKSVDEVADIIQNRMQVYVSENY